MGIEPAQVLTDPALFRQAVSVLTAQGEVRPFWEVCESWQTADFAAMDPAWLAMVSGNQYTGRKRAWLERPRGHSKTSDLALMVTWAVLASRRRASGVAVAADQDQARILRDVVGSLVAVNPWLAKILDVQSNRVANKVTGAEFRILSSDVASSWGLLADFVCFDELCHLTKRDLFDSLLSTAAKKPGCLMVCITNAGFQESWQWGIRDAIRNDPRWYFSRLEGPLAKWITADALAEQERLLPGIAFRRLWLNEWSAGAGDAFDPADIDRAVRLSAPPEPEPGLCYIGGLDLSLSRDASAFVIVGKSVGWLESRQAEPAPRPRVFHALAELGYSDGPAATAGEALYHPGDGRMRLMHLAVWRPNRGKIDLEAIEKHILAVHSRLPMASLIADVYQGALLCQRLNRQGVPSSGVSITPSVLQVMASATLDAFRDGTLDLYRCDDLIADLKALRVREYSHGRGFRLDSPRVNNAENGTRHGDTASALGLALWGARYAQPTSAGHLGSLVYN